MKRVKICLMLSILSLTLTLGNYPRAQMKISKNTLANASAVSMTNSSNRLVGTVGQTFIGKSENSANISQAGFWFKSVGMITDVEDIPLLIPTEYQLSQNYPNPFNPATTIRFALPTQSQVILKLYDVLGREVLTIVNKELEPGVHEIVLDSRGLASGVYIYRIQAGEFSQMRKLMLLK